MDEPSHATVRLDGSSLTIADLVRIARDPGTRVEYAPEALDGVRRGREEMDRLIDRYAADYESWTHGGGVKPVLDYGVTTGFGEFKRIAIDPAELKTLQHNILLSHCAGAGENADADDPAGYFPAEIVRAALTIRLNTFLKGHSGVTEPLLRAIVAMLNQGVIPLVPLRGSVGSSGDLAPLSHLFVVLLGEGRYWVIPQGSRACPRTWPELRGNLQRTADLGAGGAAAVESARGPAVAQLAADLGLSLAQMPRIVEKEGLALTNGANFTAALLALAVHDGEALANAADVAAALSLAGVCGCARALDERVHEARNHRGQVESAANLRDLVAASKQLETSGEVQDAYSLRCAPQVHGAVRDTIAYAAMVVETEINSATDNPLFFGLGVGDGKAAQSFDAGFGKTDGHDRNGERRISFCAGNFHGEPVGFAADFLAIALAELADISERRTQLLLDSNHNRNLPPNLVPMAGLNSGFMIAQYCAAGIVSENKVLAHPASVDSIPTSANSEDHNAMGIIAARKARTVLHNVQAVLAIEMLVAAQALEWRVRGAVPAAGKVDRGDGNAARKLEMTRFLDALALGPLTWDELGACGVALAYQRVRQLAEPLRGDRPLDEDIRRVRSALEDNSLVRWLNLELGKLGPAPFPQVAAKRHLRPIRPLRSPT